MNVKSLIVFMTLIALHAALLKYGYDAFAHSDLSNYLNAAKSAYANRFVEVSVNDIDIAQSPVNPNNLIMSFQVNEKNTGNTEVAPADYTLSTQEGIQGVRQVFYYKNWKPLQLGALGPNQQKEGAIFFEIQKADKYIFTYTRGYQSIHYQIYSEKGLFIPFIINQQY